LTFGVGRKLDDIGVGGDEVRRTHRFDELTGEKAQPVLFLLVQIQRFDELGAIARIQQVVLLQYAVERIFPPFSAVEPTVAARGFDGRFTLPARCRLYDMF